jgi:RNA polymerase sigma factor (sigma-70 family)
VTKEPGLAGVEGKARAFYEQYGRVVLSRARVLLGDGDAANDALQEVFLRLITSEAHIFDQPSPTGWLYRVTTNFCLNQLRDEKRRRELLAERDESRANHSSAALDAPEARALMLEILSRVPEEIQEVAVYRYVDEMTHDEIAELMGLSPRTVGNRLVAFKNKMAHVMRRELAQ